MTNDNSSFPNLMRKLTLLFCSTMTIMASTVISPSLPKIAEVFNEDLLVKLILTMPAIFVALTSIYLGKIIDMFGRKKLMIFSLFLYGVSGSAGFYLENLYIILFSRALLGIAVAGILNTTIALITDYYKESERNKMMGYQMTFIGIGGIIFLIGGGFLANLDWHKPFLIYLFSFLILPLAMFFLYEPEKERRDPLESFNNSRVRFTKMLTYMFFMVFVLMLFFYLIQVYLPFYLAQTFKSSSSEIGIVLAFITLFMSFTGFLYGKIRNKITSENLFIFCYLVLFLGFLILGVGNSIETIYMAMALIGVAFGLFFPNFKLWMVNSVEPKTKGRIIGYSSTIIFLGQFLSPIVFNPILNLISLKLAFVLCSIVLLLFGISLKILKRYSN